MQMGPGNRHGFQSRRLVSQAVLSQTPKLSCIGLVSIHLPRTSLSGLLEPQQDVRSELSAQSRALSALLPLLTFTLMEQMRQQVHERLRSSAGQSGSSHSHRLCWQFVSHKMCW